MSKATPGPWRVGRKGCVVSDHPTGHDDPGNVEYYGGNVICESIAFDANARLIAAAPDLLAAAKIVLAGLNERIKQADRNSVPVFHGITDLHSAIQKAEGN